MNFKELLQSKQKDIDHFQLKLFTLRIFTTIAISLCFAIMIMLMIKTNELAQRLEECEYQVAELQNEVENLSYQVALLEYSYSHHEAIISQLTGISEQLDLENQEFYEQIEEYRQREELYNRYEYAIYDDYGNRTDITYDQLITLQDLMQDSLLEDEDLILAIIMTESRGIESARNSQSTAKGYAQFLDGTSRFVYTDLLERDGWTSQVALDGDICIEMMVAYFDYLYEKNNGDIYAMLRSYRGKSDISGYIASIDHYLANVDKTVYDIYVTKTNDD